MQTTTIQSITTPTTGPITASATTPATASSTAARAGAEPAADAAEHGRRIDKAIASRSFAMVSTVSPAGFPHAAGVLYVPIDGSLYAHTMRTSRKARNVAANPAAAVVIPVRRLPVGPPFTVQFQATAQLVEMDNPEIAALVGGGRLAKITGHGELDEPDGVFMRIDPKRRVHTYGIGVSALALARDPLHVGSRTLDR